MANIEKKHFNFRIYKEGQQIKNCFFIKDINPNIKRRTALFRCFCNKEFIAHIVDVNSGNTKSCGCLNHIPRNKTHGLSRSLIYKTWIKIKSRCHSITDKGYKNYGGRGIKVCERWFNSFENFLLDMGQKPSPLYSIERLNNNGDYEPNNCIWATQKVQARNKRNSRFIEYKGETRNINEWAEITGLNRLIIYRRIKNGWSVEKALSEPKMKAKNTYA